MIIILHTAVNRTKTHSTVVVQSVVQSCYYYDMLLSHIQQTGPPMVTDSACGQMRKYREIERKTYGVTYIYIQYIQRKNQHKLTLGKRGDIPRNLGLLRKGYWEAALICYAGFCCLVDVTCRWPPYPLAWRNINIFQENPASKVCSAHYSPVKTCVFSLTDSKTDCKSVRGEAIWRRGGSPRALNSGGEMPNPSSSIGFYGTHRDIRREQTGGLPQTFLHEHNRAAAQAPKPTHLCEPT